MNPEDQDFDQGQDQEQGGDDRYSPQNPSSNPENKDGHNKFRNKARQAGRQLAKRGGKQLAKRGTQMAAKVAQRAGGVHGKLIGKATEEGLKAIEQIKKGKIKALAIKAAARNPYVWIIFAAVFAILLIVAIIIGPGGEEEENEAEGCNGQPEISITLDGPTEVKIDEEKGYKITLSNAPVSTTVTLKHGPDMEFVSAENEGKDENNTITWTMGNGEVKFKLKAKADNKYVILIANAGGSGGTSGDSTASSSASTSGGGASKPVAGDAWEKVKKDGKQYGAKWLEFLDAAKKVAEAEDYPIAVIVAQGALESAHGTSAFAKNRNNFFGINAVDANPNQATSYPSVEDGVKRYVDFIKNGSRYKAAYAARSDPKKMVEEIKKAGYATDPNYVNKVTNTPEFQALAGLGTTGGGGGTSSDCGEPAAETPNAKWDEVAQCESTGNWQANTGNGFYGGLQFTHQTWKAFGGKQENAHLASKEEQIAVAEKVLAAQGNKAWPNCGKNL